MDDPVDDVILVILQGSKFYTHTSETNFTHHSRPQGQHHSSAWGHQATTPTLLKPILKTILEYCHELAHCKPEKK